MPRKKIRLPAVTLRLDKENSLSWMRFYDIYVGGQDTYAFISVDTSGKVELQANIHKKPWALLKDWRELDK